MENKIYLSVELINAIMQYLSTKPFAEVHQLIQSVLSEVETQKKGISNEEGENIH